MSFSTLSPILSSVFVELTEKNITVSFHSLYKAFSENNYQAMYLNS